MPYVTVMQTPRSHQITLDEILSGEIVIADARPRKMTGTVTHLADHISEKMLSGISVRSMIGALEAFNQEYEPLFQRDRHKLYDTFYIPKRSGGLRKINAPHPELMDALRKLKEILETKMFALYHTSAFAYMSGRCTIDAIKRHQMAGSRWFLKTDFTDFFGSTTHAFLMDMLGLIFPFCEIVKLPDGRAALERATGLCFLDGGLPQGTPISPMLTNLMMIPIDHQLANGFRDKGFIYTRYADDILVSGKYAFDFSEQCRYIDDVLLKFFAPFQIKPGKTRYGSSSGSNWNLGVMLNKDNQITIGWRKKKYFKAMCNSYIADKKADLKWDIHDVQVFSGLISYYRMIERAYIDYIIRHYNEKYQVNMMSLIRADLKGD